MTTKIIIRILIGLLLLYAAQRGWWIVMVFVGTFGVWHFSYFLEIILVGVIYDSLFSLQAGTGLWGYAGTLSALAIYGIVQVFRRLVRNTA